MHTFTALGDSMGMHMLRAVSGWISSVNCLHSNTMKPLSKNGLMRRMAARLGYVKRDEVAPARRSFAAAAVNRLTGIWAATGSNLDSVLSTEGPIVRARARDLRKNNSWFQKFLWMLQSNVVGECGMTLKNKACDPHTFADGELVKGKPDKLANALTEESFWEWGKKQSCLITQDMSWKQTQDLNISELGTVGETLWRHVRGPEAGNRWNYALQPIAIDRLDQSANYNLSNGNSVRMGVEKNPVGKVVAYYLTDTDPTDLLYNRGGAFRSKRYDARDYLHVFIKREPGQTRGYPWAAAAMYPMKMLDEYNKSQVTGSVAASNKMAVLTSGLGANATPAEYSGALASGGGKYMESEPGTLEELPYGMDLKVVDWNHPNSIYGEFVNACLRSVASGLGVSYPNLANDYASVNFSSGRMSRQEEMETWKTLQTNIATDFCEPVFAAWLEMSLLSGQCNYLLPSGREIVLPASKLAKFNQPRFYGRRWQWLDPTKEVAAIAEQLRLKLTTRTRVASELGEEWLEILDELEQEKLEAEARGITLPEDVEQAAALAAANMDPNVPEPDKEYDDDPANQPQQ